MKKLLGLFLLLALAASWAAADDNDGTVDFDQGAPSIKTYKNAAGETCESLGSATLCDSNGSDSMGQASEVIVTGQPRQQQPAPSVGAVTPTIAPADPAAEGRRCHEKLPSPDWILCDNTLVNEEASASCSARYSALTHTEGGAVLYSLCGGLVSPADANAAFNCFQQWRSVAAMRGVPTDLDDARICRNDPAQGQAYAAYTALGYFYQTNQLTGQNLWAAVKYATDASRTVSCVRESIAQGSPSPWNNIQPCVAPPPNSNPAW